MTTTSENGAWGKLDGTILWSSLTESGAQREACARTRCVQQSSSARRVRRRPLAALAAPIDRGGAIGWRALQLRGPRLRHGNRRLHAASNAL